MRSAFFVELHAGVAVYFDTFQVADHCLRMCLRFLRFQLGQRLARFLCCLDTLKNYPQLAIAMKSMSGFRLHNFADQPAISRQYQKVGRRIQRLCQDCSYWRPAFGRCRADLRSQPRFEGAIRRRRASHHSELLGAADGRSEF